MALRDLYESKEHSNNFAHFSAMTYTLNLDGDIAPKEKILLKSFARKLNITEQEFQMILKDPKRYPIQKPTNSEKRLRRIFDMFKIIFADHKIDDEEREFIYEYATALGFSDNNIKKVIDRSIAMFSGKFDFEDYDHFIKK